MCPAILLCSAILLMCIALLRPLWLDCSQGSPSLIERQSASIRRLHTCMESPKHAPCMQLQAALRAQLAKTPDLAQTRYQAPASNNSVGCGYLHGAGCRDVFALRCACILIRARCGHPTPPFYYALTLCYCLSPRKVDPVRALYSGHCQRSPEETVAVGTLQPRRCLLPPRRLYLRFDLRR